MRLVRGLGGRPKGLRRRALLAVQSTLFSTWVYLACVFSLDYTATGTERTRFTLGSLTLGLVTRRQHRLSQVVSR